MTREHFTRDDGSDVPFVEGLMNFNAINPGLYEETPTDYLVSSTNVQGGEANLDYAKSAEALAETRRRISLRAYVSRYNQVYNFLRLIGDTTRSKTFENMLDLGCGYGIQPRIAKGLGIAKSITGIDIYDRASSLEEKILPSLHRRMKFMRPLRGPAMSAAKLESWQRTDFQESMVRFVPEPALLYYTVFGRDPGRDIYRQSLGTNLRLDELIVDNVYSLDRKFDLVTSFTSIEWFEYAKILSKISDLLQTGGYFYMWWPNWWAPVTPNKLTGHFPWASQRLTLDEFQRYTAESMPEQAEHMLPAYRYFDPGHPTLNDYFQAAAEVDMVPVAYEPIIHPWSVTPRRGVSYRGWAEMGAECLLDTLSDIRKERPDVGLSDMMNYGYAAVFRKVDRTERPADILARFGQEERRRPHDNLPFTKQLKPLARRVFLRKG